MNLTTSVVRLDSEQNEPILDSTTFSALSYKIGLYTTHCAAYRFLGELQTSRGAPRGSRGFCVARALAITLATCCCVNDHGRQTSSRRACLPRRASAHRPRLDSRDQARWLPALSLPPRGRPGAAVH